MSNGSEDDEIYIFVPSMNDDTDPKICLWIMRIILMIEIGILGYVLWGM